MTQFASTLYPQTNPTNPVLLEYRDSGPVDQGYFDQWLAQIRRPAWLPGEATPSQLRHAERVISRLASFSG